MTTNHVTIIFDHETGTVLDAESCSIVVCTEAESEALSEGVMDMETFDPYYMRPIVNQAVRLAVQIADERATDETGRPLRCCDEHETYDPECTR